MVERMLEISDPQEQEQLWQFYDEVFRPINEETPISQTFPKGDFLNFLASPRVVKFIIRGKTGQIVGLGMVTDEPWLDPLVSRPYFEKHFPDVPLRYIMALAVAPGFRGIAVATNLLREMINEVPENGIGFFLHSKEVNPFIPRLAQIAERGKIRPVIGAEVLVGYCWRR